MDVKIWVLVISSFISHGSDNKIKAVDHLMEFNQDAARAIFDECLNIDDESNLILDFELFENEGKGSGSVASLFEWNQIKLNFLSKNMCSRNQLSWLYIF